MGAGPGITGLANGHSSYAAQKGTQVSATAQPPVQSPGVGGLPNRRIANYSGAFAVIGGAAWIDAALIHAAQPGAASATNAPCLARTHHRDLTCSLHWLGGLTMIVSGAGLLSLIQRRNSLA